MSNNEELAGAVAEIDRQLDATRGGMIRRMQNLGVAIRAARGDLGSLMKALVNITTRVAELEKKLAAAPAPAAKEIADLQQRVASLERKL